MYIRQLHSRDGTFHVFRFSRFHWQLDWSNNLLQLLFSLFLYSDLRRKLLREGETSLTTIPDENLTDSSANKRDGERGKFWFFGLAGASKEMSVGNEGKRFSQAPRLSLRCPPRGLMENGRKEPDFFLLDPIYIKCGGWKLVGMADDCDESEPFGTARWKFQRNSLRLLQLQRNDEMPFVFFPIMYSPSVHPSRSKSPRKVVSSLLWSNWNSKDW